MGQLREEYPFTAGRVIVRIEKDLINNNDKAGFLK
jgi:hypothetical protein